MLDELQWHLAIHHNLPISISALQQTLERATGNPNIPKTPDHNFFFSCRLPNEWFISNGGGWMALKRQIHFKVPYSHCYRCTSR
jgi:hypothetical protein